MQGLRITEEIKPCKCGNTDLIHIKCFSDFHMIKCEKCVINHGGYYVHPSVADFTYEEAIEEWNKRHE